MILLSLKPDDFKVSYQKKDSFVFKSVNVQIDFNFNSSKSEYTKVAGQLSHIKSEIVQNISIYESKVFEWTVRSDMEKERVKCNNSRLCFQLQKLKYYNDLLNEKRKFLELFNTFEIDFILMYSKKTTTNETKSKKVS